MSTDSICLAVDCLSPSDDTRENMTAVFIYVVDLLVHQIIGSFNFDKCSEPKGIIGAFLSLSLLNRRRRESCSPPMGTIEDMNKNKELRHKNELNHYVSIQKTREFFGWFGRNLLNLQKFGLLYTYQDAHLY